jgi:hypothetical protein
VLLLIILIFKDVDLFNFFFGSFFEKLGCKIENFCPILAGDEFFLLKLPVYAIFGGEKFLRVVKLPDFATGLYFVLFVE